MCIVKHFSALFNKTVNDDFRAMDGCMMNGVVVKVGCFQSVSTYSTGVLIKSWLSECMCDTVLGWQWCHMDHNPCPTISARRCWKRYWLLVQYYYVDLLQLYSFPSQP